MVEDTGRSFCFDLGVGLGTLELIEAMDERTLGPSKRVEALLFRHASQEYNLLRTASSWLVGLFSSKIEPYVVGDGRNPFELKILSESLEFQHVLARGPHISTKRVLLVAI